jgi:hypothetical protein
MGITYPLFCHHRAEFTKDVAGQDSINEALAPIHVEETRDVLHSRPIRMTRVGRQKMRLALAGVGPALLICLSLAIVFRWQRHAVVTKLLN